MRHKHTEKYFFKVTELMFLTCICTADKHPCRKKCKKTLKNNWINANNMEGDSSQKEEYETMVWEIQRQVLAMWSSE